MAFMPGQAVHTNEVFVLLGENYFVERSAKQAREIIERRLSGTDAWDRHAESRDGTYISRRSSVQC